MAQLEFSEGACAQVRSFCASGISRIRRCFGVLLLLCLRKSPREKPFLRMNSVVHRVFPEAENWFSFGAEIGGNHADCDDIVKCRSSDRTFRCTFRLFRALRFQRLAAKVPQEPCERGAVLRTRHFDALSTRFVH